MTCMKEEEEENVSVWIKTGILMCMWTLLPTTLNSAQPLFCDVSVFLSSVLQAQAISQVRPETISSSLLESISFSLSLPVCLSLEPSLSALTLCHLTALPSNQTLRGNFKCLTRLKNTPWKQIPQRGQEMQDHFIHFKQFTRQFHYLLKIPDGPDYCQLHRAATPPATTKLIIGCDFHFMTPVSHFC